MREAVAVFRAEGVKYNSAEGKMNNGTRVRVTDSVVRMQVSGFKGNEVEKTLNRLPVSPKLDYNPFVNSAPSQQNQHQSNLPKK